MTKAIREIDNVSRDVFEKEILPLQQPVILRGLVKDWPAVQHAQTSPQAVATYLKKFSRPKKTGVFFGEADINGRFTYNDNIDGFNFKYGQNTPSNIIDQLLSFLEDARPPSMYAGSASTDQYFPGLQEACPMPLLAQNVVPRIWIGNKTRIAAHYDTPQNIACVMAGKRKFTLFPPEQISNLYIGPLDLTPAGQSLSLVDFHQPDFHRFPKFEQALKHAQTAELLPGDAIFIPCVWWHHVEGLEGFNVLLNYWWTAAEGDMDLPLYTLLHGLLSLKNRPDYEKSAWQSIFNHYLFNENDPLTHLEETQKGVAGAFSEENKEKIRKVLKRVLNQ